MIDRHRDGYLLTRDPARVDLDRVQQWLAVESYWATGRPRETTERAIAGSWPYTVIGPDGAGAVAFARVVTDGATFGWLCDVFVDGAHRGRGLGSWLVESMLADLTALGVSRVVLGTLDAHEVYRRQGFRELAAPERWMEIDRRKRATDPSGPDARPETSPVPQ